MIVKSTNLYAIQNHQKFTLTTTQELKTFVGIHILMGNLHYPRVQFYWDSKHSVRIPIPLWWTMCLYNRFIKLRHNLHFVDISKRDEGSTDRFWKIRSLYQIMRARCLSLPLKMEMCIHEQMVPFKSRLNVKQYVKNKPHSRGIKILALCGRNGILYEFLIYQGATTELDPLEMEVFGLDAVVFHLSQRITEKNVS